MKLQAINSKSNITYFVTLPKALVLAKGWNKGTRLMAVLNREGSIVIDKTPIPENLSNRTLP